MTDRLGSRPLDRWRARLGLFRADINRHFVRDQQRRASQGAGPIERAYYDYSGPLIHKWNHYLPLYDRYFAPYRRRGTPVRMLEIGVSQGGSLQLWRGYSGETATIFGIDINPDCARFDGFNGNSVRIGSQADPNFLRKVVEEMGGLDIVLDDGSHFASHMKASFDTLFPLLSDGGLYAAEDLHTSYWRNFEGRYGSRRSFLGVCKSLIDDMHHWYHPMGQRHEVVRNDLAAIHIHDSIVFLEKSRVTAPVHSVKGSVEA